MRMTSTKFQNGGSIHQKYTCDGMNISPPIIFSDIPMNAQSFALIMDDPDAPSGTFTHWLVWNIPSNVKELKENEQNYIQGRNDAGKIGYTGPCPPSRIHRYFFKLYALNGELTLPKGSTKSQLLKAMEYHTVAKTELIGRYGRG